MHLQCTPMEHQLSPSHIVLCCRATARGWGGTLEHQLSPSPKVLCCGLQPGGGGAPWSTNCPPAL